MPMQRKIKYPPAANAAGGYLKNYTFLTFINAPTPAKSPKIPIIMPIVPIERADPA